MNNKTIILSIFFAAMLVFFGYNFAAAELEKKTNSRAIARCELRSKMNIMMDDQVIWTRNLVLNVVDNLPGTNNAIDRLFKSQYEMCKIVKVYYGDKEEEKLINLLRSSSIYRVAMFKTIRDSYPEKKSAIETLNGKWMKNTDKIADLLSRLNPYWSSANLKKMFHQQISLITMMAIARKSKYYSKDVNYYEELISEAHQLSEILSIGIINDFPEKFEGNK